MAFGNDSKAEKIRLKTLTINPGGIDPNYFYADVKLAPTKIEEESN
jgi:hypothetical protein